MNVLKPGAKTAPASPLTPTPKVAAAGAGGIAATIIIFVCKRFLKVDVPPDVAAAVVAVVAFAAAYIKKSKAHA
jgi:hypothetical protein